MMWSGDGGSAGVIIIRARKINGRVIIGTCAGKGAVAARNGRGGKGKRTRLERGKQEIQPPAAREQRFYRYQI